MASKDLTGKVVLVTGGARGIGLDSAPRLHRKGARVVLVDVDEALAKSEADAVSRRKDGARPEGGARSRRSGSRSARRELNQELRDLVGSREERRVTGVDVDRVPDPGRG
jgi:NAD(P)-dependent dehydrogenase (short-subunit alcohol dehydrogenase family)